MSDKLTPETSKLIEKLINKTERCDVDWVANSDKDIFKFNSDKFQYKIVTNSSGGIGLYVRVIDKYWGSPIISLYGSTYDETNSQTYNMLVQLHQSIKKYLGLDIISDVESMLWKSSKIDEAINSL